MTDYFGFTMASLNENGSVFANPCKGEKNMSTLMYRPFSSWANNSEVTLLYLSFLLCDIFLQLPQQIDHTNVCISPFAKSMLVSLANADFPSLVVYEI